MIILWILAVLIFLYAGIFVYKTKTGSPSVMSRPEHRQSLRKYVKPGMKVADMGCGNGAVLIEAIRDGAKEAEGWEIEPLVWWQARQKVRKEQLEDKIRIHFGDMWGADLGKYDLVYVYQLTRFAKRFREKCQREMKKGSRVVANTYPIPGLKLRKKDGELLVYEV